MFIKDDSKVLTSLVDLTAKRETPMSYFYLMRKLKRKREILDLYCTKKFTNFCMSAVKSDMANFSLLPFNKDTIGIEVARYGKFMFILFFTNIYYFNTNINTISECPFVVNGMIKKIWMIGTMM